MSILDSLGGTNQENGRTAGVAAGIVTNNRDPDQLGRVKIKFPWLSDDNETDWVRIATLMAGADRGTVFLPEVDDEVLVAFEFGDINHPLVIGALFSGADAPPEGNADGQNNIRKITSRSGHEIVFNDDAQAGLEKVEIKTNKGHKIVLDDSTGQEKIEIIDKTGSNKMVIDSVQNSIDIESAMKLTIKAVTVEIEGTGSLTLKSNAMLTVQGMPVKIN
ncbi:MAG: phage tail protein [bacterium]|nr:phage tail protein [bacterium]